jgi:hypothetical protein
MASKKTDPKNNTKKKLPPKKAPAKKAAAPKKEKKEPIKVGPRHPHGRVKATSAGSKEALAKALAPSLARGDEDTDQLEARLKTASNNQLLRLQKVADAVKSKYGSRAGLIEAIGKNAQKSKDKDYIAKLETLSLPNLLDLAKSADRRARA